MKYINDNQEKEISMSCYVCEKDTDETTININEDVIVNGSIHFSKVICEDCK